MRFQKAEGITPSEELLAKLCNESFLSLWTYPNLFNEPGKELADLLVVFGDDVVIFSDKSCKYTDSEDAEVNWQRWYRRSITRSIGQMQKAENWIRKYSDRVFLDPKCAQRLPIQLPPADRIRVHFVCVVCGISRQAELNTGKPCLTISALVEGDVQPFVMGRALNAPRWVHVFDDTNLMTLLSELSTVSDFLDYLRKKEVLLSSGEFAYAESELDLLAYFLWNGRQFPVPADLKADRFKLEPNLWERVEADKHFLAGREENKVSYFWDGLIEYLSDLYLKEELEVGNDIPVDDYERAVRIMAGEGRFSRRLLARWILERADKAKGVYIGSLHPSLQPDVLYVLLIGPGDGGKDHNEYRKARAEQLRARCIAAKAAMRDRRYLVGIAMDARGVKGSSEDFIYLDTLDWTEEMIEKGEKLRQDLGYFVKGKAQEKRVNEREYPDS